MPSTSSPNPIVPTGCSKCPAGYASPDVKGGENDRTRCVGCISGTYSNHEGLTGLAECSKCLPGKYSFVTGAATESVCSKCSPGMSPNYPVFAPFVAQKLTLTMFCFCFFFFFFFFIPFFLFYLLSSYPFNTGKFSERVGNADGCNPCPSGYLQSEEGMTSCALPKPGQVVLSGANAVDVPDGSYLDGCNESNSACSNFTQCPAGWVGAHPPTHECTACGKGQTSSKGAPEDGGCRICAKGKFSENIGAASCKDCLANTNTYQPQDVTASSVCDVCPLGWNQLEGGASFCVDQKGVKPSDCGESEYWVPDKEKDKAGCLACPPGCVVAAFNVLVLCSSLLLTSLFLSFSFSFSFLFSFSFFSSFSFSFSFSLPTSLLLPQWILQGTNRRRRCAISIWLVAMFKRCS